VDDPDERMENAEAEPVLEAPPLARKPAKGPYHERIAPELVDELEISIGQGLALAGVRASDAPDAMVGGIADHLERVFRGEQRLPRDPSDAALALGCLYGHALCKTLGWGFAHLRRARPPGIVVVSRDARFVVGPRAVIDETMARRDTSALRRHYERLRAGTELPDSGPMRYQRIR
jgi:hypothetical protein